MKSEKKIIIGLTGAFGSGKSTVARMFKEYGAKIIDADKIAHRVIAPSTNIYKKIIDTFGKAILKRDKRIDRNKLAKMVFGNKSLLKILNKIVHPEVIRIIKKEIKKSHHNVVVLDAPLLIEAGLRKLVDKLIVVKISRKKQIQRILKNSSLSKTDILKRINVQMPLSAKCVLADFVIDNSGTLEKTKGQVCKIRRLLWRN